MEYRLSLLFLSERKTAKPVLRTIAPTTASDRHYVSIDVTAAVYVIAQSPNAGTARLKRKVPTVSDQVGLSYDPIRQPHDLTRCDVSNVDLKKPHRRPRKSEKRPSGDRTCVHFPPSANSAARSATGVHDINSRAPPLSETKAISRPVFGFRAAQY